MSARVSNSAGFALQASRADGAQLVEAHHERVVETLVVVEDDDPVELGQLVSDLEDLGRQLVVLDEAHARLGVTQDVGDLLGRTRLVQRHGHAAVGQCAEVGQVPLDPVVGEDPDLLTGSDSQLGQPGGDLADGPAVVGPGQHLPPAADAAAQRGPIGHAAHRVPEGVDDGVALDANAV